MSFFGYTNFNLDWFAYSCKDCGGGVCVCHDEGISGKWAAHCMSCDNSIGESGVYHPVADTQIEAYKLWNELNKHK
jgi:hypothetical protein